MKESKMKLSRRNFLLAVGASSVAGAAAIAVKTVPQAQPLASGGDKKSSVGYHASAHIRNYYRTTKV